MQFRFSFVLMPAAIVAAAGFAWFGTAGAVDVPPGSPQIAQAAPPAVGGATDRGRRQRTFSPQTMCKERVARGIGHRAYLKARLDLKPEQTALWDAFEKAADAESAKNMARCATLPMELKERPNFADRVNMQDDWMKARLASLEAVKPSLLALYAALTPEQKAVFDRPMSGRGHRHWRGWSRR
jgi:hypothetical protein